MSILDKLTTSKMYYEFARRYPHSVDRLIEQTRGIIALEEIKLEALKRAKADIEEEARLDGILNGGGQ